MKVISKPKVNEMDYCNIQNRKFLLVFGLSGFLFLNLTFATPYQIMKSSLVYATSNNNEEDEPNPGESSSDSNTPSENEEQQDAGDDSSSSSPTASSQEQKNQCSSDALEEPTFINENGCPASCPIVDSQTEIIPEGCPQPIGQQSQEQEPLETPNSLNDLTTNDNNPDSNVGFLDSGVIEENILKDKGVRSGSIELARIDALIGGHDIIKYFGEQTMKDLAKTVSVCVETLMPDGNTLLAVPHCLIGLNVTQKFAVEPGQINLDIQHSPQLSVDSEPKFCSIDHLVQRKKNDVL